MLTAKPRFPIKDIILFGMLPSMFKKWVYRLKGYKIGKGVSFGFGSIVSGRKVEIGDFTEISFFTIIRCSTIRIGRYVNIGAGCIMETQQLEIGEGSKINEQVFVGGLQFPDSRLVLGRNCQIMQMTFINPTHSITIGDDSGIGGDCLIFGHASWLSKFEGYPVDFRSIEIGKSVSIAWRVFVGVGAKIGDGAVIGANSLVNRPIPPRCLAVGFPAKVVAKAPYFPRTVSEEEKATYLCDIVQEMVGFLQGYGMACRTNGSLIEVIHERRRWWRTSRHHLRLWVEMDKVTLADQRHVPEALDVFLSLRGIPDEVRLLLSRRQIMWIDIENKERADFGNDLGEEVVQYLRRYGVRLFRVRQ